MAIGYPPAVFALEVRAGSVDEDEPSHHQQWAIESDQWPTGDTAQAQIIADTCARAFGHATGLMVSREYSRVTLEWIWT